MTRTLIAVPCLDWVYTEFFRAFVDMVGTAENVALSVVRNTLIYNARNMIAREAVENGFDRVLWIDSDVIVQHDTMQRLAADMETGLDFVTGIYYQRKKEARPVVYRRLWWNVSEGEADAGALHCDEIPAGLFEVAGAGFGCCMTSGKLLRTLVEKIGAPFTPLIGVSEDLSFCLRARQAGFRLWADGRIQCGHYGGYTYDAETFAHNCT